MTRMLRVAVLIVGLVPASSFTLKASLADTSPTKVLARGAHALPRQPATGFIRKPKVVVKNKEWCPVLHTIDLCDADIIPIEAEGKHLLVVNAEDGSVHCIEWCSPFADAPLLGGFVRGDTIVCPLSGFAFSLETGKVVSGSPGTVRDLVTYPLRTIGRKVEVYVERDLSGAHGQKEPEPMWYLILWAIGRAIRGGL